jgi:hypothetical protein
MENNSDSEEYVIFENKNNILTKLIKEQKEMKKEIKEIKIMIENMKYDFTKKIVKILNDLNNNTT